MKFLKPTRPTIITIAILMLLSAIITWASFSFAANLHPATISNAQFQFHPDSMIMQISGRLPNPCAYEPHPVLVRTQNPHILALTVAVKQSAGECIDMVGGSYQLAFDVRSLKFDLIRLHLNTNADYNIVAENGAINFNINFSNIPFTRPFATDVIQNAVLTAGQNGTFIASTPGGKQLVMDSPLINLNQFKGQNVEVEGYLLNITRPGFSLTQSVTDQPTLMLVTGLTSTSN